MRSRNQLSKLQTSFDAYKAANERPIPSLPQIEIETLNGLPEGMTNDPTLLVNRLLVRNNSSVLIENFASRLQLPEPIINSNSQIDATVGTLIGWKPLLLNAILVKGKGTGGRTAGGLWLGPASSNYFVYPEESFSSFKKWGNEKRGQKFEISGAGNITGVWELTIDKLPPGGHVSIQFFTSNSSEATNYIRFATVPLSEWPPKSNLDTNELDFYLEGEYGYEAHPQPAKQHFIVPISFDSEQRKFSSFGIQSEIGRWHPVTMDLY